MKLNKIIILRVVALVLAAFSFLIIGLSGGELLIGDLLMPAAFGVALIAHILAGIENKDEEPKAFVLAGIVVAGLLLYPSIYVFYAVGAYPATIMILGSIVISYATEYFAEKL